MFKKLFFGAALLMMLPVLSYSQGMPYQAEIDMGVEWLVDQQNPDEGSWGDWSKVAKTGFAVTKLCDYAKEMGYDSGCDQAYPYYENVLAGINYIVANISEYDNGDPLVKALYVTDDYHETYPTGIAMMAVASCNCLDLTYVLEGMMQYFAATQSTTDGGWGYGSADTYGDNSNSGYATLGIKYASSVGVTIPQSIIDGLVAWIGLIQDPVSGASDYMVGVAWPNILKTGNLLFQMELVGFELSNADVQKALGYIETTWGDMSDDPGWGDPQVMFCLMKGLDAFGIDYLSLVSPDDTDWYNDVVNLLMSWYNPGTGTWPGMGWGDEFLSTVWALFVLERIVPPRDVDFDIHPTSWPNPLNAKSKGVTPSAILGTENFDVTMIDPASIKLEGVPVFSWSYEDVTTPAGDEGGCNATELGPDGYLDLTLKFVTQEIFAAIAPVNDGDALSLTVTGKLMDSRDIVGDDCVVILKKGKSGFITSPDTDLSSVFSLSQNYPNPFSSFTTIEYQIPEKSSVILRVYNMYGQEIETLVNKELSEGNYTVEFDAQSLPAGIYFYKLNTNNYTQTKRMTLK